MRGMLNGRVAILNGFGISLGDGIIGLSALRAAQLLGVAQDCVLFRGAGSPMLDALYREARAFAPTAPMDAFRADAFDGVIDIRDFAFDPAFRGMAMIDFFLMRLGVDVASVPPAGRRNVWLGERMRPARGGGYVLVCPRSSMALRDMPPAIHAGIVRTLGETQDLAILTQGPAVGGARSVAPKDDLAGLCALVAGAGLMVSTDTAMVHLADAFDVPCLALFTTHRPVWRVRDYPTVRAVHLPADLPEALEFSRGAEDLAAVAAAWHAGAGEIEAAVRRFAGRFTPGRKHGALPRTPPGAEPLDLGLVTNGF